MKYSKSRKQKGESAVQCDFVLCSGHADVLLAKAEAME